MTLNTNKMSAALRSRTIDLAAGRLLITNFRDTEQEKDLTKPPNCNGFGRIRHFRRHGSPGWPQNPLPIDPAAHRLGYLARSFIWLLSLSLRVGVDLETGAWAKFPGVCPYCRARHRPNYSTCTKETKKAIDLWRLRDLANANSGKIPKTLRRWEIMFGQIYPGTASQELHFLSTKLVEELGEVEGELTKPQKRNLVLRERGVDTFAFELADLFAWSCQVSSALRVSDTPQSSSVLATAVARVLNNEICPHCLDAICTCDPELETEEDRAMAYRYLEPLPHRVRVV